VAQGISVILFFDIEFFKYFFRVLHEAGGSWLECLHNFQNHPVYATVEFGETARPSFLNRYATVEREETAKPPFLNRYATIERGETAKPSFFN
jgi:7,8-dihydro-6-hydroxymethylpterin-pyrophosphokinase